MNTVYVFHSAKALQLANIGVRLGPPLDLHPRDFAAWLAAQSGPIATNHPCLVDLVAYDLVKVVGPSGAVRSMTEHPEYNKWRGMMRAGEFWMTFGEAWARA